MNKKYIIIGAILAILVLVPAISFWYNEIPKIESVLPKLPQQKEELEYTVNYPKSSVIKPIQWNYTIISHHSTPDYEAFNVAETVYNNYSVETIGVSVNGWMGSSDAIIQPNESQTLNIWVKGGNNPTFFLYTVPIAYGLFNVSRPSVRVTNTYSQNATNITMTILYINKLNGTRVAEEDSSVNYILPRTNVTYSFMDFYYWSKNRTQSVNDFCFVWDTSIIDVYGYIQP